MDLDNIANISLLNIDNFIKSGSVLEVKNGNLPSLKYKTYDPDSLWSEVIFGSLNSKHRKSKFGYIKLPVKCVSPLVLPILTSCCDEFYNMGKSRVKYLFDSKINTFIEATEDNDPNELAKTGLLAILNNLANVDFSTLTRRYNDSAKLNFIRDNLSLVLIDKFPVIPAGLRDINIFSNTTRLVIESDINIYYSELLHGSEYIYGHDDEMDEQHIQSIHTNLQNITTWIKNNNLKGKQGLFRSSILKKRLDYSARIILLSDPKLSLDEVIVPFHILFILYLPLCYHVIIYNRNKKVMDAIQAFMKVQYIDDNVFNNFADFIKLDPSKLPPELVELIKEVLGEIMPSQRVICKRDPVLGKGSYFSAVPLIGDGHVCFIPTLILDPLGADSDGDQIMVAPVFSESAKKEAKKTLSYSEKNTWINPKNFNSSMTGLTLDAIATIYSITK